MRCRCSTYYGDTHYSLPTTHYSPLTAYHVLLTMLQLLAISAAISGRVPVVPRVPCNSGWLRPGKMTLAGVADDYVLQLPGTEEGQVHCHLAPGGARCALPEVLPAWHRSALLSGVTAEEAPAARVAASVGYAARGTVCDAGLRVRAAPLRRALRREQGPLVEVQVDSGSMACDSSVALEARLDDEERSRLASLRALCPGYFALPGKKLDHLHRRRQPIKDRSKFGVRFPRTAQGAYNKVG